MNNHIQDNISFAATLIIIIFTSAWIGINIDSFSLIQMDMDEAVHANRGLDIASDMLNKDFDSLWNNISKPEWYPPGHGLLSGFWLAVIGPRLITIRLYSTLFFLILGVVLWFSIRDLIPGSNPYLFLIPPLFLISDRLHTVHAGMSMLEVPAIALAIIGLLYLTKYQRNVKLMHLLLALFFGFLCFFTKYSYGLVFIAVFFICQAIMVMKNHFTDLDHLQRNKVLINLIIVIVIVGIILFCWFLLLEQWQWFLDYATAQPASHSFWSIGNFTYYPRRLIDESINGLASILILLGLIQLNRNPKDISGVIPYALFFIISLLMLTIKVQNISRFTMILLPPLWIMSTYGANLLFNSMDNNWIKKVLSWSLVLGLLFAGLFNMFTYSSNLLIAYENTTDGINQAYDFIADVLHVEQNSDLNLVMLGRTDLYNGQALHFHLESKCMLFKADCHIQVQDFREIRLGWPEQNFSEEVQNQRYSDALEEADYRIHFFNRPEQPEDWQLLSEKVFVFQNMKNKKENIWVSIYKSNTEVTIP